MNYQLNSISEFIDYIKSKASKTWEAFMGISIDEVKKIAHLARLELPEEVAQTYTEELSKILDYFASLKEVDTDNVQPTFHPLTWDTPMREDEVKPFEDIEAILANAPELWENMIVVPKVVKAP
jgi:aspartyl-tRNA(Asn)/glutamyl-tRNA(Gln) amidotransferase subunit C